MNVFDRHEEERRLQQARQRMIEEKASGVWTAFGADITALVNNFNTTREGLPSRAKIQEDGHENRLVIERHCGLAKDRFHAVTIAIHIVSDQSHYTIIAERKKFLLHQGNVKKTDEQKSTSSQSR